MEGLKIAMKTTCEKGIFSGIKIPHDDLSISHIFYMDDVLFQGEWSKENQTVITIKTETRIEKKLNPIKKRKQKNHERLN